MNARGGGRRWVDWLLVGGATLIFVGFALDGQHTRPGTPLGLARRSHVRHAAGVGVRGYCSLAYHAVQLGALFRQTERGINPLSRSRRFRRRLAERDSVVRVWDHRMLPAAATFHVRHSRTLEAAFGAPGMFSTYWLSWCTRMSVGIAGAVGAEVAPTRFPWGPGARHRSPAVLGPKRLVSPWVSTAQPLRRASCRRCPAEPWCSSAALALLPPPPAAVLTTSTVAMRRSSDPSNGGGERLPRRILGVAGLRCKCATREEGASSGPGFTFASPARHNPGWRRIRPAFGPRPCSPGWVPFRQSAP